MSEQERLAPAARSPGDPAGFVPWHLAGRTRPHPGTGSYYLATATLPVREGEIVALTSLRGIAAMAVVMQHFLGDGSVALPGDDTIVDAARLSGC
jgi:hypothetical protein